MITNETLAREQEARVARAVQESSEMRWTKTSGGWAVETASGGLYLVGTDGKTCSCPDYRYTCAGTEVRCKHGVALGQMKLARGEF